LSGSFITLLHLLVHEIIKSGNITFGKVAFMAT
jgi:hypothetical protein